MGACRQPASTKCSPQRNCNRHPGPAGTLSVPASMKCSFRRNCNAESGIPSDEPPSLNEVQLPKELQLEAAHLKVDDDLASMKCSSRRNCNRRPGTPRSPACPGLNEVQLPKELQPAGPGRGPAGPPRLNEVQFPKELQPLQVAGGGYRRRRASMKCSSRRNCNHGRDTSRKSHYWPQ